MCQTAWSDVEEHFQASVGADQQQTAQRRPTSPPAIAVVCFIRRVSAGAATELELLYSARSVKDRKTVQERLAQFAWCPVPEGVYRRGRVVQEQLTAKGEHRSAGTVDLLLAAVAEQAGLVLLHFDRDFETIARTTGQPVRMIDLK